MNVNKCDSEDVDGEVFTDLGSEVKQQLEELKRLETSPRMRTRILATIARKYIGILEAIGYGETWTSKAYLALIVTIFFVSMAGLMFRISVPHRPWFSAGQIVTGTLLLSWGRWWQILARLRLRVKPSEYLICDGFEEGMRLLGYVLPKKTRTECFTPSIEEIVEEWAHARVLVRGRWTYVLCHATFIARSVWLILICYCLHFKSLLGLIVGANVVSYFSTICNWMTRK
ncbi:hypothetical protein [Schlesneria paludicola]|uniref:hypothetical protein n=1 Tax=Schlesneria paludicola TaxID=360056 RepID=UPI00029A1058|nr:hypothetical protein [Schlesneria paludicola]